MIPDAFLSLFADCAAYSLGFLPTDLVSGLVTQGLTAWSLVEPWFAGADYFAPIHELLAMLGAVYAMRVAAVAWFGAGWARRAVFGR